MTKKNLKQCAKNHNLTTYVGIKSISSNNMLLIKFTVPPLYK